MSVSKWRYNPDLCDGHYCPGDCDLCGLTDKSMSKFYFTFGCDNNFPYGFHEYVEIEARNEDEARAVFQAIWPNRDGSPFLNCASVYDEKYWKQVSEKYYKNVEPSATVKISMRS